MDFHAELYLVLFSHKVILS